MGQILSLVLLYAIHDLRRLPRVQDCASYARFVTCRKASAGTRVGTSGQQIGNAHLTWAFAEAAPLCLRQHPAGQKRLGRLEKKHEKGNALRSLAHQRGRAVYPMRKRKVAFDMDLLLRSSGGRGREPDASRDLAGMSLP
jgi:transposase